MYSILGIDVNLNNFSCQEADYFLFIGFKVFLTYMIDPPPILVGVGLSEKPCNHIRQLLQADACFGCLARSH